MGWDGMSSKCLMEEKVILTKDLHSQPCFSYFTRKSCINHQFSLVFMDLCMTITSPFLAAIHFLYLISFLKNCIAIKSELLIPFLVMCMCSIFPLFPVVEL